MALVVVWSQEMKRQGNESPSPNRMTNIGTVTQCYRTSPHQHDESKCERSCTVHSQQSTLISRKIKDKWHKYTQP